MTNPQESTDDLDPAEALVESCLPLVFETYDAAVAERVREPVVLLIDCEDEIGGEIAEAWVGAEAVEDNRLAVLEGHEAESEGISTVFARPMPLGDCRRDVPDVFPYLKGAFEGLPAEAVLVMAVTAGGAATVLVPFSSRP